MCASTMSFLSSISTLITIENISKLKIRCTKLGDWINVNTLLYEKTWKQSMVIEKIDEKEAQELKKIYNHYLDKRKDIMNGTKFKVEVIFSDVFSKDPFSEEKITKPNCSLAKMMRI